MPFSQSAEDDLAPSPDISPADVRLAAMNLLARREHSRQELRQKLARRFGKNELIDTALQRLSQESLQSDERFAQCYVRQRAAKGYGPLRIRQELQERGITENEASTAMDEEAPDWCALATEVYLKKYGRERAADVKERSRRARFMQYRGFAGEHYQRLLRD